MFIFSEEPPLKHKGHGLSVLLYNLFYDSGININTWFTFLSSGNIYAEDVLINPELSLKIIDIHPALGFLRKSAKINFLYNQFLFILFFPFIVIALWKQPYKQILIPIGASAYILYKIWMLKLVTKNPIWLYIVDDLNEISSKQNQSINKILCTLFMRRVFRSAQQIFAITNTLATIISETSGKETNVILPCFQKVDKIKSDNQPEVPAVKFTFIFTGGLNFLYNDTLKKFADFLCLLQNDESKKFHLIIQTYSSKSEFEKIGFTDNVEYRTSETRSDLYKTYQEADAFIVPYSFDPANRTMISTSFPQKIAQIIQFGIPIVAFGPKYGSVIDFFYQQKLDFIIDKEDYELFKTKILELTEYNSDSLMIERYLEVYDLHFSQKACLHELLKNSK